MTKENKIMKQTEFIIYITALGNFIAIPTTVALTVIH
jgi:hypothetical protein